MTVRWILWNPHFCWWNPHFSVQDFLGPTLGRSPRPARTRVAAFGAAAMYGQDLWKELHIQDAAREGVGTEGRRWNLYDYTILYYTILYYTILYYYNLRMYIIVINCVYIYICVYDSWLFTLTSIMFAMLILFHICIHMYIHTFTIFKHANIYIFIHIHVCILYIYTYVFIIVCCFSCSLFLVLSASLPLPLFVATYSWKWWVIWNGDG